MTKLSVNINKVATLRNARGGNVPNLIQVAKDCERFGAQGITVHPRPDQRHIRYSDVKALKAIVTTEFNIEGYPSPSFNELVLSVKPEQVTLVPDPPEAITSNAGWDAKKHYAYLKQTVELFHAAGIRVSIFMETEYDQIEWAAKTGADRIELYTEAYALNYAKDAAGAVAPYAAAAKYAKTIGLGVNAGHDLNSENLLFFHQAIPMIDEVSIGHALIADALYWGLEQTIQTYLKQLR